MKRYDREVNVIHKDESILKDSIEEAQEPTKNREVVNSLTDDNLHDLINIFCNKLKEISFDSDEQLIISTENDQIIFNDKISLDGIKKLVNDTELNSRIEFLRKFYMFTIDSMLDELFEKPVTLLQEVPYSFIESESNENIINYDFLK